jgi:putative membrane protein
MDDPALFPPLNAALNGLAGLLLVIGVIQVKRGNEEAHKRFMLAAFGCSVLFLISYLYYHFHFAIQVKYQGPEGGRYPYLGLLLSHTVLAAAVPFLALRTIFLGLKDRREAHRRLARITFPVWLYVSITGVLIYLVLYVFTDSGKLALDALPTAA